MPGAEKFANLVASEVQANHGENDKHDNTIDKVRYFFDRHGFPSDGVRKLSVKIEQSTDGKAPPIVKIHLWCADDSVFDRQTRHPAMQGYSWRNGRVREEQTVVEQRTCEALALTLFGDINKSSQIDLTVSTGTPANGENVEGDTFDLIAPSVIERTPSRWSEVYPSDNSPGAERVRKEMRDAGIEIETLGFCVGNHFEAQPEATRLVPSATPARQLVRFRDKSAGSCGLKECNEDALLRAAERHFGLNGKDMLEATENDPKVPDFVWESWARTVAKSGALEAKKRTVNMVAANDGHGSVTTTDQVKATGGSWTRKKRG